MSKYFFRFHCTTKFPNEFVSNEVARCQSGSDPDMIHARRRRRQRFIFGPRIMSRLSFAFFVLSLLLLVLVLVDSDAAVQLD